MPVHRALPVKEDQKVNRQSAGWPFAITGKILTALPAAGIIAERSIYIFIMNSVPAEYG